MATDNTQNTQSDDHKRGLNGKQTIGAFLGIAALLVLLFLGVSNTKEPGAEVITDEPKPDQSSYQAEAVDFDYEPAILQEYEQGTLLELEGKIHTRLDEALKGEQNIILNVTPKIESDEIKVNQVMLVFLNSRSDIKQHQDAHVFGRYIGTMEYEGPVGTLEAPAVQVDYLSIKN